MDIKEVKKIAESIDKDKVVSLFQLLKEKKYFAFFKACLFSLWGIYGKYIKGKSITIKGRKISLTAIILGVLAVYVMMPSAENKNIENKATEDDGFLVQDQDSVEHEPNTYDKDGLKIYNFERCEQGICGLMENSSDKTFDRVIISVTFDDRQRNVLAEGSIDAQNVKPMTRTKLNIKSEVDFYSFTLSDVTVE